MAIGSYSIKPRARAFRLSLGFAAAAGMLAEIPEVRAVPAQIIILRHGEKENKYALCDIGVERSQALGVQYLGKNGTASLLPVEGAEAWLAITLHTLETAAPAADSWSKPVVTFSSVPLPDQSDAEKDIQLNQLTQEAAQGVLTNPQWEGKTVVMVWEHKHIASKKLEGDYPGQKITLRQLLNLDQLSSVPDTWEGSNYDYFWIATYGNPASTVPTSFQSLQQDFAKPYDDLPANDWGNKEKLPSGSKCKK